MELDEGDQGVQTSNCKIIGPGDVMYSMVTIVNAAVWYI